MSALHGVIRVIKSKIEVFLQSSKLAIRETAQLVEPFYGVTHDHRFHKFASWSATQFGMDDQFTQVITQWEPWVEQIVDMRNAVEHPAEKTGGRLVIHNFRVTNVSGKPSLIEPAWCLSGGPDSPVLADMEAIIEGAIKLGEELLVGLLYKFKGGFPIDVHEIPVKVRDPSCPKCLRVRLSSNIPNA